MFLCWKRQFKSHSSYTSPRSWCAQHVEGNSSYARQPRGRARGHAAGAGSWKGSATLAVTHFLCPEQGAIAGVTLWGVRDSFRGETAPKPVTTSAFSQGKGEAQAGTGSSRALLPADAACHAWGPCTGPGRSSLLGQLCSFPGPSAVPRVTQKLGVSTKAAVAVAGVPIATDSRGQCHIDAVPSCPGQREHIGVCLVF